MEKSAYKLYAIAFVEGSEWSFGVAANPKYYAVAVASETKQRAIKRLLGFYTDAKVLWVDVIRERKPEWDQDRIEGTIDLMDYRLPTPQSGNKEAVRMRASNHAILERMFSEQIAA